MTTTFEESFLAALDATKPAAHPRFKIGEDQKYVSLSTDWGEYHFAHRDPRKGGWQGGGTIRIYGPTFGRTGNFKHPMEFLGSFNLGTGKLTYAITDKITKGNTEYALDLFLRKHGDTTSGLFGWSVDVDENGWGRITKPPTDKRKFSKEVAVFGAELPGQKIVLYTPKGDRRLTPTEERKLNISPEIYSYIRERLSKLHTWHDLLKSYTYANANVRHPQRSQAVNTWETGPGERFFKKSERAYGMSKVELSEAAYSLADESVAKKVRRLAAERYDAGYKAGVTAARRSGSTISVPRQAEVNNDFRRGYQDGVRGTKSR